MTILTKPSSEKKQEKVPLPLAMGGGEDPAAMHGGRLLLPPTRYPGAPTAPSDLDNESMVFNRPQFTCVKTLILFLISVIVMMMGILGGYTLYRMIAPQSNSMHFHALCDIPYDNASLPRMYSIQEFDFNLPRLFGDTPAESYGDLVDDNGFREEVEVQYSNSESYAKINVPDFKDGRSGRFMHDFKENQSAIIDTTANRCFIMPLDRQTTLPPKGFIDLIKKMGTGYYNIDTERVRRHMRVVTPPITDLSTISERIANECYDMKVYMLERYVSGVFKREAKPITENGKFAEFSGKGIIEFDLINIADIEEYERNQQK